MMTVVGELGLHTGLGDRIMRWRGKVDLRKLS